MSEKNENRFILKSIIDEDAFVKGIVIPIHGNFRAKAETGNIPLVSEYLVKSDTLTAVTFRAENHPKVDTRWVYLLPPVVGCAEELAGQAKAIVSSYEERQ